MTSDTLLPGGEVEGEEEEPEPDSEVLLLTHLIEILDIMAAGTELQEREMIAKSRRLLATATDPIERIRLQCLTRGASGIKGMGKRFRIIDDDGSRQLNMEEFTKGIQDLGIVMSPDELREVFDIFDIDKSGSISFDEFLLRLRPPLSNSRRDVIDLAFDKLDKTGDGVVTVKDMKGVYDAKHHPKYENGEWTEDQVFEVYLRNFDSPNDPDYKVTKEEFIDYCAGLSASIDNDMYFNVMMRRSWKL